MKDHIKHIFEQTPCPTDKELELYVQGAGSKEELRKVELHLAGCEMCSDIVSGIEAWGVESFGKDLEDERKAVLEASQTLGGKSLDFKPSPGPGKMVFWGIAASICLIFAVSVLFWRSGQGMDGVLATHGQWEMPAVLRGNVTQVDTLSQARSMLSSGRFPEALALLKDRKDPESSYWRALCHDRTGQKAQAKAELENARGGEGKYARLADFQWVVFQIGEGNAEEARHKLMEISQDRLHERAQDAAQILKSLGN